MMVLPLTGATSVDESIIICPKVLKGGFVKICGVCMSFNVGESRYSPVKWSLTVPAQTLTANCCWYHLRRVTCGLSSSHMWVFLLLNIASCMKHTSCVNRTKCGKDCVLYRCTYH